MKEKVSSMYDAIRATEVQKNNIISNVTQGVAVKKKSKVISFPKALASVASIAVVAGIVMFIIVNPFSAKNSFYITTHALEVPADKAILSENAIELDTKKCASYGLDNIIMYENYESYIRPTEESVKTEDYKQTIVLDFMTFEGENIDTITLTPNEEANIYIDNFIQNRDEEKLKKTLEKYKDKIEFYENGYEISDPEIVQIIEQAEWNRYFEEYSCVKSCTQAESEYNAKDLFSEAFYYSDADTPHYFGKSITFDYEKLKEENPIINVVDVVKSDEMQAYHKAIESDKNEFSEDSGLSTDREQTNEFLKLQKRFLDQLKIKVDVNYKDGTSETKTVVFETELFDYISVKVKAKYAK